MTESGQSAGSGQDTSDAKTWAYFVCPAIDQFGWVRLNEIRLPISDLGFRQGVTAVERLRTYNGKVFGWSRHMYRFAGTLETLGLSQVVPLVSFESIAREMLVRNGEWISKHGDIGMTWWATPDSFAMHCNPINHRLAHDRRQNGQAIVLTGVQQPSPQSWSRQAKVRSRLHYFLADQGANSIIGGSTGILCDADGTWTESSIANLAIVHDQQIVFPPADQVLHGVTQSFVRDIASEIGINFCENRIGTNDIKSAKEILLMGTDVGLWFASDVWDQDGSLLKRCHSPSLDSTVRRLQHQMQSSINSKSSSRLT